MNHLSREIITANIPVHITMRLKPLSISLRSRRLFAAFKRSARGARKFGLGINEFSLMGNHLHMIAEAKDNQCLARGMRSFAGSLGKSIRAAAGGAGSVFNGRFHLHALKTPTEYRRALAYVLLNRSKHAGTAPRVDAYSSAPYFRDWFRLLNRSFAERLTDEPANFLVAARSWLGRRGWWRSKVSA